MIRASETPGAATLARPGHRAAAPGPAPCRAAPRRAAARSSPVRYSPAVIDPTKSRPPTERTIEYKGAPLDGERGPGLGCFQFQLIVLAILVVITPLSVAWNWAPELSAVLLFAVILLLLLTGQTIIFLLRLVAADRRAAGRRRPLSSTTRTVGEIEDAAREVAGGRSPDAEAGERPAERDQGADGPAQPDEARADPAERHSP